ncbi:LamG domain-containing protein [Arthrobacter cheniae]|uniref:LamG domain-containing protein n=1 Tax=Arthrobacter cheniae TaxID=1258888 RepID=A0A3A5M7Y4_9MICC|nr:LamG domain-containing protein [Arthrobacter cheniae]
MGSREITADPGISPASRASGSRRSQTIAVILTGILTATLSACTPDEDLGAANVWSLTGPDASAGDVALSAEDGARWTDEGLQLSGTNYASTSTPGPIATDSSFTVSAWARPTGQPAEYTSVLTQAGDVAGAFFLGVAEGFWSFSVKPEDGNGGDFVTNRDRATQVEVEPDAWVHLAGVYDADGGRARFFLNGYPVSDQGIATDSVYAADGPLLIGRGQTRRQPSNFFGGTITDVRTWPRALSEKEVAAAAQAATPEGASLDEPEKSAPFVCPEPGGGICLGTLAAGTYETTSFEPALTYTVPEGWTNREDLPGNMLLSRIDDPEEGTWGGSYIGVYQNVRAPAPCGEQPQPEIGTSDAELATWYRTVPGLQVMRDVPVTVGGLPGVVLDLTLDSEWRTPCPPGALNAVPVLIGGGVSDLHHVIGAPLEMRLFLLDWDGGNVAIEVTALLEQHSLTNYLEEAGADAVVNSFDFAS